MTQNIYLTDHNYLSHMGLSEVILAITDQVYYFDIDYQSVAASNYGHSNIPIQKFEVFNM